MTCFKLAYSLLQTKFLHHHSPHNLPVNSENRFCTCLDTESNHGWFDKFFSLLVTLFFLVSIAHQKNRATTT